MVIEQLKYQLNSLQSLLLNLSDKHYNQQIHHLNQSTIGEHTRHIIEIIESLTNAYEKGKVDYFNRNRNLNLQQNRNFAQEQIVALVNKVDKKDKKLQVQFDDDDTTYFASSYKREIMVQTEHVIHHLALIKVGLFEQRLELVDEKFGLANSTIKFKQMN